ncbi:uncharacterized protein [Coffea arabica]|uniref:ATP-dependent DNA helicase n=1 Tax=Coffea arabica TaxID=13443 RepID=A0A6P6W0V8_COFAR
MDRNTVRRIHYANMPKEKKDELLQRRRERYARKKAGNMHTAEQSSYSAMPEEQKNKIRQHRRELYAAKKTEHVAPPTASTPVCNVPRVKHCQKNYRAFAKKPPPEQILNASAPETCSSAPNPIPDNNELADLFDSISTKLQSSSSALPSSALPSSLATTPGQSCVPEAYTDSLVGEGTCIINVEPSDSSKQNGIQQILVSTQLQNSGKRQRTKKGSFSRLKQIPTETLVLPDAPMCQHCSAKRFHLEPPNFCCSGGEVSVVHPVMPYDLFRLYSGTDEDCVHFRKNVRTYNNNLAFSTFAAKYDKDLTKNTKGVYTFRVQGQIYHLLNSLKPNGHPPTGIQLYFYDQEEELSKRLDASPRLRDSTLKLLMGILEQNPYTKVFKSLRELPNLDDHSIFLNSNPGLDQRLYNMPTSSEVAAIWTETDNEALDKGAHIQVYTHANTSHRIQHYFACYDSLQYPLLFPRGEAGWHYGIPRNTTTDKRKRKETDDGGLVDAAQIGTAIGLIQRENEAAEEGKKKRDTVSAREYYCYKLQIRDNDRSMLLHTGRLLQQFAVDIYVKIETSRLEFHRKKQKEIRTEILKGVTDSISSGQTEGSKVGRRVYLPSSFIGGPRDMRRRYIDAMSLVQRYGKPDIFITMTCNRMWKEIQDNLKYGEEAQDRPDLVSRVFRAKLELLKAEITKKKIFGEVAACVYVIEFQKRGLPHAHMLIILKPEYKPLNPEAYDMIVSAEIPDPAKQPHLHFLVMKHMLHGPCGSLKKDNVCMKDGVCKNHYPKSFTDYTTYTEDGYPHYRRRMDGRCVRVRDHLLDNRWVVPYNPYLLALFDCHLNVEICSTVKLVKYLYKYVYKGHDRVSFYIHSDKTFEDVDEISDFQSGRWVAAAEAFWRIFRFGLNEMTPSVYALQVHLPGEQMVSFHRKTNLADLVADVDFSKTMLTEFFYMNQTNKYAQELKLLYKQFPEFFVWKPAKKRWSQRKRRKVVGRLVTVSPAEGERYFLRLLLSCVCAPASFDHLLTVNGIRMNSYREAAFQMGLLQSDTYIEDTLDEAATFQMPSSLRSLFAVMLAFCSPSNPKHLWEKYETELSRDYQKHSSLTGYSSEYIRMLVLQELSKFLEQMGKSVNDFHLVSDYLGVTLDQRITKEIEAERSVQFAEEDLLMSSKFNAGQKCAYDSIMAQVFSTKAQSFFIDGPGGTGKTFLYRSLLATLRSQGYIAIAVASSGVAASILPGGRTAHSRFKIPLDISKTKACQVSKQSSIAKLLIEAKLILWDEASMAKKETIEAFDMLLRDIMESDDPFGGKVVVFGGDFRQTLPVIRDATRDVLVQSSFVNSPLWSALQKITLTENMRAVMDRAFSEFLLRIGEGREPEDKDGKISLCKDMIIPYDGKEASLNRLIESVFGDLNIYASDPYQMINRCILSPTNNAVDDVNQIIIDRFPKDPHVYISSDRTLNEKDQGDYEDFLNSLSPKGLPPHKLILKENCPVILLRNLNPMEGLCNGTRLICRELRHNTICAEIAVGQYCGKKVFLPKIPLQTSDGEKNGIPFKRTQFPIKLCFAMTINKSQGQTLDDVGIYLREPVFSHGQLYVALSRAKSSSAVKVLIVPATYRDTVTECKTRNVVFDEVLTLAKQ